MDFLLAIFSEFKEPEQIAGFTKILALFGIAWLRLQPFVVKQIDSFKVDLVKEADALKKEMASQMTAVRGEMHAISQSVSLLAENMKSLERGHDQRILVLEIEVEQIKNKTQGG